MRTVPGRRRPAVTRGGAVLIAAALLLSLAAAACSGPSADTAPPTRAQLTALLRSLGNAVLAHDRAAFLAGFASGRAAAAFRGRQAAEFGNLARLPFARWSYALGPRAQDAGAQAAARRRFGPGAVVYRVTESFALRGIDAEPTSHELTWTFVRGGGGAVAADDSALALVGGASWRGPWDFGPLTIVRGRHSLVLGHASSGRALLATVARTVDAAVPVVTSVWGSGWPQDVLVVAPVGPAELSADLGGPDAGSSEPAAVAAVATADNTDPVTGRVLGQRIVVDPARLSGLSPTGLRILLQHEVTHIADAGASSASTPTWLAEGFAEYVGNLHSGQPIPVAAAELAAAVRRGRLPARLPASTAFGGASAARAYQEAWLACRLLAARLGAPGLVRLYRAVGRSTLPPERAAAVALRRVAGLTLSEFVGQWRRYLHGELGRSR